MQGWSWRGSYYSYWYHCVDASGSLTDAEIRRRFCLPMTFTVLLTTYYEHDLVEKKFLISRAVPFQCKAENKPTLGLSLQSIGMLTTLVYFAKLLPRSTQLVRWIRPYDFITLVLLGFVLKMRDRAKHPPPFWVVLLLCPPSKSPGRSVDISRVKPRPNDRNILTQHIATLLPTICKPRRNDRNILMQHSAILLGTTCVKTLTIFKLESTTPNMSQQGRPMRAKWCAQQCCDMLRWVVAIVWPGL